MLKGLRDMLVGYWKTGNLSKINMCTIMFLKICDIFHSTVQTLKVESWVQKLLRGGMILWMMKNYMRGIIWIYVIFQVTTWKYSEKSEVTAAHFLKS